MRLNLGAADRRIDGFISVDIAPPADQIVDLRQPWPWPDSSIDEVVAYDVIEHLPNRIHTMNELHRVLKPGAIARIEVPSAVHGAGWAQDPTHCSAWCRNSFQYFEEGSFAHRRLSRAYGITARFRVLELKEQRHADRYEEVWKVITTLKAVK